MPTGGKGFMGIGECFPMVMRFFFPFFFLGNKNDEEFEWVYGRERENESERKVRERKVLGRGVFFFE